MAIESNRVEPNRVSNTISLFETRLGRTRTEQRYCSTRTRLNRTELRPSWTRLDRARIEPGLCSTRLDWARFILKRLATRIKRLCHMTNVGQSCGSRRGSRSDRGGLRFLAVRREPRFPSQSAMSKLVGGQLYF